MTRTLRTAALALALAACSTPISPTLLQDGQLIVAGIDVLAATPLIPAGDAAIIMVVDGVLHTALTDLQKGSSTPADFVAVATDEIKSLAAGPILTDLHANATITAGVAALQAILPVIAADLAPPSAAPVTAALTVDPGRAKLQAFVALHGGGK
jgi:hypothetical protein